MQLTSGVFACVRAKGGHFEQLLWRYSAIWQQTFQFLSNVTLFSDCFWKLPQIRTSNSRKVVRQHTEGMAWSIMSIFFEIYFSCQQWKNFENPLRIDKVITMSLVYYFFGDTVYICHSSCIPSVSKMSAVLFLPDTHRFANQISQSWLLSAAVGRLRPRNKRWDSAIT